MPCRTEPAGNWRVCAKLNLGLSVGPPGVDGYHPVNSLLVAIDACDVLRVARRPGATSWEVSWAEGAPATDLGPVERNLAHRAWQLAGSPDGYAFHLVKHLPAGGGLGAGSADAAAVLRVLVLGGDLDAVRADSLAQGLGSDVAFFLGHGPAWATGRGELLEALPTGPELHGVLACGPDRVPTREAYHWLDAVPARLPCDLAPLRSAWLRGDRPGILAATANDFEIPVRRALPALGTTPDALLAAGAEGVLLAGSGACWVGWASDALHAEEVARAMSGFDGWVVPFRTVVDPVQRMT